MASYVVPSLALLAQAGGAAPAGGGLFSMLLPFALIMGIMYFFLIRPQQRRQREHNAMLKAIQPGDKVVTTGGIVGTVMKAEENSLRLRIAPSVEISVIRSYVAGKVGEGEPAP